LSSHLFIVVKPTEIFFIFPVSRRMSSKSEYYCAKSDMDEMDRIGDKLAQDLKKSIRQLVRIFCLEFSIFLSPNIICRITIPSYLILG
jgi:hypothetical protein